MEKDFPNLRNAIENMKNKLSKLNEETKNLRNIYLEFDRSILTLKS